MNKQILTWVAVATLSLNLQAARAADMTLNLFQEYALFGTGSSGTLWLGNFGTNGGSLLSSSQVNNLLANDKEALFNLFRPVASSFSIANGRIAGMTDEGLLTSVSVGNALEYFKDIDGEFILNITPATATQFAGQDMYFLANNRVGATANSWFNETLILFKAVANFGTGNAGDGAQNTPEVEISTSGGSLLLGTQNVPTSGVIAGAVVPEPSSASLLIFGATALVALRRLRKNV
jgi:hypothetical protein